MTEVRCRSYETCADGFQADEALGFREFPMQAWEADVRGQIQGFSWTFIRRVKGPSGGGHEWTAESRTRQVRGVH